ncbi:MAG: hypothetical protein GY757_32365 [bacterium]|nr:hypothetical protein [bacterium]
MPEHYNKPVDMDIEPVIIRGRSSFRLAVILTAPGCIYARTTGGCRFCGFAAMTTKGIPVTRENYEKQLECIIEVLKKDPRKIEEVDIYNSGSFLAEEEVPDVSRRQIFQKLSRLEEVKKILVEARPEHVTGKKLQPLVDQVPGKKVEIGIGLESADDEIRTNIINKGIPIDVFEKAAKIIRDAGAALLVYVLVKPAGITEKEAFRDAVATAHYLKKLSLKLGKGETPFNIKIAYQPAFVARDTPLEKEYQAGRYEVLNLWTVVELVRETAGLLPVQVALWDEGLSDGRVPRGCSKCDAQLRKTLEHFNGHGDVSILENLHCSCRGKQ